MGGVKPPGRGLIPVHGSLGSGQKEYVTLINFQYFCIPWLRDFLTELWSWMDWQQWSHYHFIGCFHLSQKYAKRPSAVMSKFIPVLKLSVLCRFRKHLNMKSIHLPPTFCKLTFVSVATASILSSHIYRLFWVTKMCWNERIHSCLQRRVCTCWFW